MACECNIVGLLSMNYSGITSASINGGTSISVASDGLVLLGQTLNTLSLSGYPFLPGQDMFLGVSCPASASAENRWIQKHDCNSDTTHFIPLSGGKASVTGGPINNVYLDCDPGVESRSFNANSQGGPTSIYLTAVRRDGFNLIYSGGPIAITSASPQSYNIVLGLVSVTAYLQSFSLSINPPSPATVSYSFVVPGNIL